jgi:hypothetical protein
MCCGRAGSGLMALVEVVHFAALSSQSGLKIASVGVVKQIHQSQAQIRHEFMVG